MCCEECYKYEKCDEDGHLKDNCCPKCPEYDECMGSNRKTKDYYGDTYNDNGDSEF